MTSGQTTRFNNGLKQIGKGTVKDVQSGMKKISKVLAEVRAGSKMTEAEMADLGDKILNELVQAGMGEKELKELMVTMEKLGVDTTNLEQKFKSLSANSPKPNISGF
jgi:hypothetical protein